MNEARIKRILVILNKMDLKSLDLLSKSLVALLDRRGIMNEDGAPYGNDNAAKDHVKKATPEQRKKIDAAVRGKTTKTGVTVNGSSGHGGDRIAERVLNKGYDVDVIIKVIEDKTATTFPGNAIDSTMYRVDNWGVVVGNKSGRIVTVINYGEGEDEDD